MKLSYRLVPAALALSLSFGLGAQPVAAGPASPAAASSGAVAEFNNLPEIQKSRACGHLLVGMAMAGQREHVRSGANPEDVPPQVVAIALAGVLHFVNSGAITEAEKADAELVSQKLAGGAAQDHIEQTHKCASQVSEQVSNKKFLAEQLEPAMEIAKQQMLLVGGLELKKMEAEKASKSPN